MPEGFDTLVGDRGLKLSGGQRQRIALARAFLKDSPILLLDEATSALDHESEDTIREASVRLMRGRTVVAIAHRLTTLRNFDRIVVLKDGQILHDGPPGELIDSSGHYTDFIRQKVKQDRRAPVHPSLPGRRLTDRRRPDFPGSRKHVHGNIRPRAPQLHVHACVADRKAAQRHLLEKLRQVGAVKDHVAVLRVEAQTKASRKQRQWGRRCPGLRRTGHGIKRRPLARTRAKPQNNSGSRRRSI